jgi:hypothetical protein
MHGCGFIPTTNAHPPTMYVSPNVATGCPLTKARGLDGMIET